MVNNKKGKLRNNDGIVNSSDYIPRLAMPGARDVVDVKEESWGQIVLGWSKGLVLFVLILILLIGILYSGLSATLMMLSSTSPTSSSREWVVRNTWSETGGTPPMEQEVIISATSALPAEWWNRIMVGWTGISNPATVRVVSNDYDTLYISDSKITNLTTNKTGNFAGSAAYSYNAKEAPIEQNYKLDNEYLVECVSGSCKKDTYFIIDETQIFGERQTS